MHKHKSKNMKHHPRKLSFISWFLADTRTKLLSILMVIVVFGASGLAGLNATLAATGEQVVGRSTDGATVNSTFYVSVQQYKTGAWLDYGTRTTPVTLNTSEAKYRLTFASSQADYSFNGWRVPCNGVSTSGQTVEFSSTACDGQVITLEVKSTSSAPAPTPAPTPTPSPSPAPAPAPRPTPIVTNPTPPRNTPLPAAPVPDTEAPITPAQFVAMADIDTGTINLKWVLATDNVAVDHYELSRSTDETNWEILNDKILSTTYIDTSSSFAVSYTYRLRAFDVAGNASPYALATSTATTFVPNVTVNGGGRIANPGIDDIVIEFSPESVLEDAVCSITESVSEQLPRDAGYELLSGPFTLVCKVADGKLIEKLEKAAQAKFLYAPEVKATYNDIRFYTATNDPWQAVESRKDADRDVIDLQTQLEFVVFAKTTKTPLWLKIGLIIVVIGAIGAAVVAVLYWRYRKSQQSKYYDYLSKERGY